MKVVYLIIGYLGIAAASSIITIGFLKDDLDKAGDRCAVDFRPGSDYEPAGTHGKWIDNGRVYGYSLAEDSPIVRSFNCL